MDSANDTRLDRPLQSPCIGICELNDSNICIGCYRSTYEIGLWGLVGPNAQRQMLDNAKARYAILKDQQNRDADD
jgi:predicted Fe-S protein YdhL (DUF1289 family)